MNSEVEIVRSAGFSNNLIKSNCKEIEVIWESFCQNIAAANYSAITELGECTAKLHASVTIQSLRFSNTTRFSNNSADRKLLLVQ